MFESLSVIGLGYIGLPTAAVFARAGLQVYGMDINEEAVRLINSGEPHIHEPDLDTLVAKVVTEKRLVASTEIVPADVHVIAVPTPFDDDKSPVTDHIMSAARVLAPKLEKGNLIILESTSPVGTTEELSIYLGGLRSDLVFPHENQSVSDISIAHCPERVLPGKILTEVVENDRVIGGVSSRCAAMAASFYKIVANGNCHVTDARTAEMAKLTENAFRDVNIAFANELSLIADKFNINVWDLIELSNLHPRVNILNPGPGVGGHCIAVDPWFIVHSAPEEAKLIHTARLVNDGKPGWVLKKIKDAVDQCNSKPNIACFGLAFKANIDDLRESPAVQIVEQLLADNYGNILVVEPFITVLPEEFLQKGAELINMRTAFDRADIIVLLVDHDVFKNVENSSLAEKIIIDTRGVW